MYLNFLFRHCANIDGAHTTIWRWWITEHCSHIDVWLYMCVWEWPGAHIWHTHTHSPARSLTRSLTITYNGSGGTTDKTRKKFLEILKWIHCFAFVEHCPRTRWPYVRDFFSLDLGPIKCVCEIWTTEIYTLSIRAMFCIKPVVCSFELELLWVDGDGHSKAQISVVRVREILCTIRAQFIISFLPH